VVEGKILNGSKFRVYRSSAEELDEDGNPVPFTTGAISSLQKEQASVKEVKEGHECGMKARVNKKLEIGDILEFYIME
jgi:translation initiation factor IF-2